MVCVAFRRHRVVRVKVRINAIVQLLFLYKLHDKSRVLARKMKYNSAVEVASLYEFRDKSSVARWRHVGAVS